MAYLLGYIAADGTITVGNRGNKYLEVQSVDEELPRLVRTLLQSGHHISKQTWTDRNWKPRYRLQIGSKELVGDLERLGIVGRKAYRLKLPDLPDNLFSHFVRGFFDGDGHVHFSIRTRADRPSKMKCFITGFTSCSKLFLSAIHQKLKQLAGVKGGSLCFTQKAYRLLFSGHDSVRIYHFMYEGGDGLLLKRKWEYFKIAVQRYNTVGR